MLYAITSPHIYLALINEIKDFAPSMPISDAEARKMPYLQAVIKEGLRIWPPVSGIATKLVPKEGDTFNGMHIPGGTEIGFAAFGLAQSKEVWGSDAKEFRPERWLIDDQARLKEMDASWELVFAHGRWKCMGQNMALMELNKVVVEVSPFVQAIN
jgi:cytochrome P450